MTLAIYDSPICESVLSVTKKRINVHTQIRKYTLDFQEKKNKRTCTSIRNTIVLPLGSLTLAVNSLWIFVFIFSLLGFQTAHQAPIKDIYGRVQLFGMPALHQLVG